MTTLHSTNNGVFISKTPKVKPFLDAFPQDVIGYGLKTNGGGMDGMDRNDKPKLKKYFATPDAHTAGVPDNWHDNKSYKAIISIHEEMKALKKGLSPEQKFAIETILSKGISDPNIAYKLFEFLIEK